MKKLVLGMGAALLAISVANAQDVHHTQYFSTPLELNPALTGLVKKDLRASLNYRTQWYTVSPHPFTTGTASFDMAVNKNKWDNGNALGIGILGVYDRSGTGNLQNIQVGLSAAYHLALGAEKQHTISLGLQGMMVQKSIDFNALKFEDQFDPASGLTPYTTGESFQNKDLTYLDANLGLMYSGRVSEHATAYAGFSAYHLGRPTETFLNGTYSIHRRYTGYLGGSFDLNDNMVLYASGLYQRQGSAEEIQIGAAAGFVLNPGYDREYQQSTVLYLGAWYRYGDGLCPYIGLEWSKMTLGISYDVNTSSFTPATNANGAYELSLTFNGAINKRAPVPRYNTTCPKF